MVARDLYKQFRRPMWIAETKLEKLRRELEGAVDVKEIVRLAQLVRASERKFLDASLFAAQQIFASTNRKNKGKNLEVHIKEGTKALRIKELVFKCYYLSAVVPVVLVVGERVSKLITELLGEDSVDRDEISRLKIVFTGFRKFSFASESVFDNYFLANMLMYPIAMDGEDPEDVDRRVRFGNRPYKRDNVFWKRYERIQAVMDFHGLYGWEAVFFTELYIYLCSGFSRIASLLLITGYDQGSSEVQEEVTKFLSKEHLPWRFDEKNNQNNGCVYYSFPYERKFEFLWNDDFQCLLMRFPAVIRQAAC